MVAAVAVVVVAADVVVVVGVVVVVAVAVVVVAVVVVVVVVVVAPACPGGTCGSIWPSPVAHSAGACWRVLHFSLAAGAGKTVAMKLDNCTRWPCHCAIAFLVN